MIDSPPACAAIVRTGTCPTSASISHLSNVGVEFFFRKGEWPALAVEISASAFPSILDHSELVDGNMSTTSSAATITPPPIAAMPKASSLAINRV